MRPAILLAGLLLAVAPATASARAPQLDELVGTMHQHSAYSDGYPGSTPASYFASARRHGLDFEGSGEHSDTNDLPIVANQECTDPDPAKNEAAACLNADPQHPENAFHKWDATLAQAKAATTSAFTAFRGFEWSSQRFGHIGVYFTQNITNALTDGGDVSMDTFYAWAQQSPALGGGADGLYTFNHPGDKFLCPTVSGCDPTQLSELNWDHFRYVPALDNRFFALEVFNGTSDFGSAPGHNAPAEGWYAYALDKGWHVGAVGAEDRGHQRGDDWGSPGLAKTIVLAGNRSPAALQRTMRARHVYAIRREGYRLRFTVDGNLMGARLERRAGAPLHVRAAVTGLTRGSAVGGPVRLELVTSGGRIIAAGSDGGLDVKLPAAQDERYLFVRAVQGGENIAYSSPVWVTTRGKAPGAATVRPPVSLTPAARPQAPTPFSDICVL
ncbi:MAG: hypothetical protein JWO74_1023 [Solirubrobacterales bacterium]|nr:hypothetical protein [Solirubrobacterales bacterium]